MMSLKKFTGEIHVVMPVRSRVDKDGCQYMLIFLWMADGKMDKIEIKVNEVDYHPSTLQVGVPLLQLKDFDEVVKSAVEEQEAFITVASKDRFHPVINLFVNGEEKQVIHLDIVKKQCKVTNIYRKAVEDDNYAEVKRIKSPMSLLRAADEVLQYYTDGEFLK